MSSRGAATRPPGTGAPTGAGPRARRSTQEIGQKPSVVARWIPAFLLAGRGYGGGAHHPSPICECECVSRMACVCTASPSPSSVCILSLSPWPDASSVTLNPSSALMSGSSSYANIQHQRAIGMGPAVDPYRVPDGPRSGGRRRGPSWPHSWERLDPVSWKPQGHVDASRSSEAGCPSSSSSARHRAFSRALSSSHPPCF